eukprot:1192353-Prorocentrum_minimum.AAC.5
MPPLPLRLPGACSAHDSKSQHNDQMTSARRTAARPPPALPSLRHRPDEGVVHLRRPAQPARREVVELQPRNLGGVVPVRLQVLLAALRNATHLKTVRRSDQRLVSG